MDASTSGPPRTDPDTFDLRGPTRHLRSAIGNHKLLIVITCLVTVGLVSAYIAIRPPIYQAEVKVYSEPTRDLPREQFYDRWNIFRKDDVGSEPELILVGAVLPRTIQELGLTYDDVYHPVGSQLREWWRTSPIGIKYRELKHSIFPKAPSQWELPPEEEEFTRTLLDLGASVTFTQLTKTYVGTIQVKGPSPRVAEIANKIIDVYQEERANRHHEEAQKAFEVLKKHADDAFAALEEVEARLQAYREEGHVFLEFTREKTAISHGTDMQVKALELEASIAHAESELAEVERQLAAEAPQLISGETFELNALRRTMEAQLVDRELALRDLLNRYKPDSPEVEDAQAMVADLKHRIDGADEMILASRSERLSDLREALRSRRLDLRATLAGSRAQLDVLRAATRQLREGLDALPAKERMQAALIRERDIADTKYRVFLDKQMQAEASMVAALSASPSLRILQRAKPPSEPVWPNTKFLIFAAIAVGLLMGVMLAGLRELLDSRIRQRHIEDGSLDVPVYATIDVARGSALQRRRPKRSAPPAHKPPASGPRH